MNTIRTAAFFLGAAIAACTQHLVRADDAVGLMRVDDGTNGLAETVMPFVPMDESGPGIQFRRRSFERLRRGDWLAGRKHGRGRHYGLVFAQQRRVGNFDGFRRWHDHVFP